MQKSEVEAIRAICNEETGEWRHYAHRKADNKAIWISSDTFWTWVGDVKVLQPLYESSNFQHEQSNSD